MVVAARDGVNGWLEQARQWAGDQANRVTGAAGVEIGTGILVLAGVLVLLLAAAVVVWLGHQRRRRVMPPAEDGALAGVRALSTAREDEGARAKVALEALLVALAASPGTGARERALRLEEQGGHLTRAVVAVAALGRGRFGVRRAVPVLEALSVGDLEPARVLLAAEAEGARGSDTDRDLVLHLATLRFVDVPALALAPARRATVLAPGRPEAWSLLGLVALEAGVLDDAREASEKVLTLGAGSRDRALLAGAIGTLGEVHLLRGALDRAEEYFNIALTYQAGLLRPDGMIRTYLRLCGIHEARGDWDRAADIVSRALALEAQLGRAGGVAELEVLAGELARRRGRLPDACGHWVRARQLFHEHGLTARAGEVDAVMAAALQPGKVKI